MNHQPATKTLSLRVPTDLLERLEKHASFLSESMGGARITHTHAALHLMQLGLDAAAAQDMTPKA